MVLLLMVAAFGCSESKKDPMSLIADQPDGLYAYFQTPKGDIVAKLEPEKAPLTTANFVGLAEGTIENSARPLGTPYFDSLLFFRVEPGFVIQGGDPLNNATGGPGYSFPDEFHPDLRHNRAGTLAMANSGPNTNGSQFYFTLKPTPQLDNHYSIFGYVVKGEDVLDSIQKNDPMQKVRILRKGAAAESFDAKTVFDKSMAAEKQKQAEQQKKMDELMEQYKSKAETTESGLMYIMEDPGKGPKAQAGQTVSVHYSGYLLDGTKFDSSYDRGQPIEFPLGTGQVIPGWDEGIQLLAKGGKCKLIIPYQLAYGEMGRPPVIPAKATLVFDVELVDIK